MPESTNIRVGIDSTQATVGALKYKKAANDVTTSATRMTAANNRTAASMKTVGKASTVLKAQMLGLFGVLVGFSAINVLVGFEERMSAVRAVSGATETEMAKLTDQAKLLGATTRFSAQEAAEGMEFLSRAGFKATETLGAMPGLLNLAAAGALDLGRAADIASNIMSGFSINASEASKVADLLAAAAASSNTTVEQLGEGMKFVAPVAAAFKQDIGETTAILGAMANAGIQSTLAGTNLRLIMAALGKPTKAARGALAKYGLTVDDVSPKTNKLVDIINELARVKIDPIDLIEIFGRRGFTGIAALVGGVNKDMNELRVTMADSGGAAKIMADIMNDNLKGSLLALKSAIEGTFIELGEAGLSGVLRTVVDATTSVIRVWAGAADTIETNRTLYIAVATAISLVVKGMIAMFVINKVIALFKLWNLVLFNTGRAIAFLFGPVGLMIAAIAIIWQVVSATKSATDETKAFREETERLSKTTELSSIAKVNDQMITLAGTVQTAKERLRSMSELDVGGSMGAGIDEAKLKLQKFITESEADIVKLGANLKTLRVQRGLALGDDAGAAAPGAGEFIKDGELQEAQVKARNAAIQNGVALINSHNTASQTMNEELAIAKIGFEALNIPMSEQIRILGEIEQKYTDGALGLETFGGAVERVTKGDSFQQLESTAVSAIDGASGAMGDFIASGVQGTQDLAAAFSNMATQIVADIARIIVKQLILNSISAAFGGPVGGSLSSLFAHNGAVVGAGNNVSRNVPVEAFAGAQVLHGGGIAGGNNVPAILKRGEEVLTERDPRHVRNGGGSNGDVSVQVINQVAPAEVRVEKTPQVDGSHLVKVFLTAAAADVGSNGVLGRALDLHKGTKQKGVIR